MRDFRNIFKQKKADFKPQRIKRRHYPHYRPASYRLKVYLVLFCLLGLLGALIYFIFFTGKFLIKEIKVIYETNEPKLVKSEEINKAVNDYYQKGFLSFWRKNILFFNSFAVKKQILRDQRIAGIRIIKELPDVLTIKISEVKPLARLVTFGDADQWLIENGQTVPYHNDVSEFSHLPIVYDKTNFFISEDDLKLAFINVLDLLKRNNQIFFPLIIIQKEAGVLKITAQSEEGWQAFFIPDKNFSQQIDNLNLVLKQKLQDRSKLEYIDLRFGNRVFYKNLLGN